MQYLFFLFEDILQEEQNPNIVLSYVYSPHTLTFIFLHNNFEVFILYQPN